ncbi:MAG: replicative DNA helicase [Candidatus Hydrothermota bacterium]|nr:MAG: replicative DNA helicase [Candidatus Hydrothermae bacterium]
MADQKLPPHSIDAEAVVLGAMMLNERALLRGLEVLKPEDFYLDAHRKIFNVIAFLFEKKKAVDLVTVKEELAKRGQLEQIGGAVYLTELVDSSIPAVFEHHLEIVLEKSVYRKVIEVATSILEHAYSQTFDSADELLDMAEQRILDIRERRLYGGFRRISDFVEGVFEEINQLMQHRQHITGIPTGFDDIDIMTSGFQPGDLIVIASRPSMGKTSFVLNILRYLSVEKSIPTAIFSLEMSTEQLVHRLLCMEARLDAHAVRSGSIKSEDIPKLTRAAGNLRRAPIFIDDTPAISIMELRAKARRIVREEGVKLLAIDYLQLIQGPKSESRQQEISAISRSLKALAKELRIPVVALSQLSRAVEQRHDKRPQLSDLRESGAIEQDADTVMFIFRPEVYEPRNREVAGIAEIIIGKQRNGPIGTKKLHFIKEYMRFEPFSQISEEYAGIESEVPF